MRIEQEYRPKVNLDEERNIGWTGYLLIALVIIFASGVMEKIAEHVKIIS